MKSQIVLFSLLVITVVSCAPSQVEIQATIQAAIAQTEAAKPTTAPTFTPVPTRTPTETPQPVPTPGLDNLIDDLNVTTQLMEGVTQVVDALYINSSNGPILQIDARSTADEYDEADIVADVFIALARSYDEGFPFEENLFALRIVGYDVDFEYQGRVVSEWKNLIAWFNDEITTEELALSLIYLE